jgi:uncharacterized protein (DUF427 family)
MRLKANALAGPHCRYDIVQETVQRHVGSQTVKAIWNNTVIAESADTVMVENNHYFPASALKQEFVVPSSYHTMCSWKGQANYYSLNVAGKSNENAVWYYPEPMQGAETVAGRVAFWKGVQVVA